jgi:DNA-binding PadR family transcriptional regulator
MQGKHIGEFEQLVLLAILQLDDRAFGIGVRNELDRRAGRSVSRGALYRTFDRLEAKGYLGWELEVGTETQERGGVAMRRFWVTDDGLEALKTSRAALLEFWKGLEGVLD